MIEVWEPAVGDWVVTSEGLIRPMAGVIVELVPERLVRVRLQGGTLLDTSAAGMRPARLSEIPLEALLREAAARDAHVPGETDVTLHVVTDGPRCTVAVCIARDPRAHQLAEFRHRFSTFAKRS